MDSGTKLSANACGRALTAVLEGSRSQLPYRFSVFQREGNCDTQPSVRNELQVQASFVVVLGLSGCQAGSETDQLQAGNLPESVGPSVKVNS